MVRFIPTLVGNTNAPLYDPDDVAVHPHARGEHAGRHVTTTCDNGSSPRSWGTQFGNCAVYRFERFIPTLVGNTGH